MADLEQLSPEQRQRRVSSQRKRALFGGVAGGTTLAAASMALAPKAARLVLKKPGSVPKSVLSRARSVDANKGKWQERANNTWLFGALPGAGSGLMAAQATAADARDDARRLRRDGSMRPVAKSDEWQDYVSPSAMKGHEYLLSGARDAKRSAQRRELAGSVAAGAGAGLTGVAMSKQPTRSRMAAVGVAGVGAATGAKLAADRLWAKPQREKQQRWKSKAGRIRSAGEDRMLGLRDDGPKVEKAMSDEVVKALLKPTGAVIGNAVRVGGVARTPTGKLVYRRGGGQKIVRQGQGVR